MPPAMTLRRSGALSLIATSPLAKRPELDAFGRGTLATYSCAVGENVLQLSTVPDLKPV